MESTSSYDEWRRKHLDAPIDSVPTWGEPPKPIDLGPLDAPVEA